MLNKRHMVQEEDFKMLNLTELKSGTKGIIASLEGDTRFLSRITSIGFIIGCPVTVIQNTEKQPLLIFSRDTLIALSRKEGKQILVEVTE